MGAHLQGSKFSNRISMNTLNGYDKAMSAASPLVPRKVWTRDEVNRLSWDGFSLELINGELIDRRMGKNPPHIYWKNLLSAWLVKNFDIDYVRSEDPIDVAAQDNPTSEPEPDLALTVQTVRETKGNKPTAEYLRLVIEVSDTTFWFDRNVKAPLYARAGIREYWIVDVRKPNAPEVMVFKDPRPNGTYAGIKHFAPHETIMFEDREFRIDWL